MQGWNWAKLTVNEAVGPDLHRLTLEVPTHVALGFHSPGQYHRVRMANGDEAIFAIASAPGRGQFEYLIRTNEGVAKQWAALPVGTEVEVTMPEGAGFPLDKAMGRNLLLVGTGTGFAPLRSVVNTIRSRRAHFGRIQGAYGVLSPAHLAYGPELSQWAVDDIHIIPTVTTTAEGWTGAVGFVQSQLDALAVDDAVAFLCGQLEMIREVRALLGRRGLPPERVFLNFEG